MSVIESIKSRKSVRSYINEPLNTATIDKINRYIRELPAPFGTKARIELVGTTTGDQPVKLGTYGVVSGANHFLALILKEEPMADIGGGYMFEQVILYCTKLGLNTCWLGATFRQGDFLRHIGLRENERLAVTSPVGYKSDKKRLLETIMRAGAGSNGRKPFESLFFKDSFDTPLNQGSAGEYKIPLEMVRLAPSASNKQPWRVLQEGKSFHFYHLPNRFSLNDMGIALCHFELSCKEINLRGTFQMLDNTPSAQGLEYVISWVCEN